MKETQKEYRKLRNGDKCMKAIKKRMKDRGSETKIQKKSSTVKFQQALTLVLQPFMRLEFKSQPQHSCRYSSHTEI
jgi:hypothetical protein